MRAVRDDVGKTAIVMDDEEEYLLNTQRCAKCNHSFQCEGDFRFYCHWREDCYCIGDWADCSGYQPKGEREACSMCSKTFYSKAVRAEKEESDER